MAEHCWTHVSMPAPDTLPINAWQNGQRGEHLQQIGGNAAGDRDGPWPELFRPGTHARAGGTLPPFSGSSAANTLVNTKRFFGMLMSAVMRTGISSTRTPLRVSLSLTRIAWQATRICGVPACLMSATPGFLIQGISISYCLTQVFSGRRLSLTKASGEKATRRVVRLLCRCRTYRPRRCYLWRL